MNKIIFFILLLTLSTAVFSQQINPAPTLTKQDYLAKSKKQKTTAWLLLGGGTVMGFVGLTQLNFAGSDDGEVNNTPGTILFFTGLTSVATSIPFFSASKRNKRKAMNLSFMKQRIPSLQKNSFVYQQIPSLKLKIDL